MHLMRKRAELLVHIQNTNTQYNLPDIGKKITDKSDRAGAAERFMDSSVRKSIEVDPVMISSALIGHAFRAHDKDRVDFKKWLFAFYCGLE
jgi:hypothetical protein